MNQKTNLSVTPGAEQGTGYRVITTILTEGQNTGGPSVYPIGGIGSPPHLIGNFDLELDCSNADLSPKDTASLRYIVVDSI